MPSEPTLSPFRRNFRLWSHGHSGHRIVDEGNLSLLMIDEMLGHVAEDAEALGCVQELADVRKILSRGTSAHRQLKDYELTRASGASDEDSLKAVVDSLIRDTAEGLKT